MREILFRGRRLDNGGWVEGFYVCLHDHKGNESHRIYTGYAETDCGYYYPEWFEVDPATVCRYTGLQDKEGTIVFCPGCCRKREVSLEQRRWKCLCGRLHDVNDTIWIPWKIVERDE